MKNLTSISLLTLLFLACIHSNNKEKESINKIPTYLEITDSLKQFVTYNANQLVFTNATLIDGTGQSSKYDQTILIENRKIKAIGNTASFPIPTNSKVVDLKDKTIIPGLVGVHNHLHIPGFRFIGDVATKLYLAAGVTTIQTCGAASPYQEIALAKRIEEDQQIGPDIVTSAPYITGAGGSRAMIIPRDEQHIRDTMQHWIAQGVTWFKVYRHTKPADLKIILDEAHKNNCKVTGHFCSITFEEATKLGIDGIEHGLNSTSDFRTNKEYGICNGGRAYIDEIDIASPKVKRLQQLMIDEGVFLNSTLAIYESNVPKRAFADARTLKAMSPYLINQYQERRKRLDKEINDRTREKRLKRIMAFNYQFYKMGGLLGSGTDPGRHNLPGYGDQRDFQLLVEAGFSVEEAIQVMTSNGAAIIERSNIGSIAIDKRADFVILNGDLTKDPSVIKKVETVFKNGIGYDSPKIISFTDGLVGLE